MISAGYDQSCFRHLLSEQIERLDHQFEALVSAPLSECENAVNRIAASREIREFRPSGQNAMRPQVHIVAAILVIQNLSIAWHQYRNGVGKQKHARSDRSRKAIKMLVPNSDILQLHRIHQVMKCDVRVAATQTGKKGRHQTAERNQRIPAEGAEQQVEPDDVRLELAQRFQQPIRTRGIIEGPATDHRKSIQLRGFAGQLICQNGEVKERIAL
ncbi:MAG: hypothetical protein ACM3WP_16375 [Acidobacteriota bacterium]